jgi:hypothetical protein
VAVFLPQSQLLPGREFLPGFEIEAVGAHVGALASGLVGGCRATAHSR